MKNDELHRLADDEIEALRRDRPAVRPPLVPLSDSATEDEAE